MKIEIKKLTKVYGQGRNAVLALNELDLTVSQSEICIVRGPNGSGKTTLISILSGDLEQTTGTISLVADESKKPNIAVVNQFNNLLDELTIREHFNLLAKNANPSLVPVEILDLRPAEISRGQLQIVAIALALTPQTDLLLADEPTGALGRLDSEAVYEFIRHAAKQNDVAVILVTHDANAEKIAKRVVRLNNGRISDTWIPGSPELQVVNDQGWVKIPDSALNGLATEVAISASPTGALIEGRIQDAIHANKEVVKRKLSAGDVVVVAGLETRYENHIVSKDLSMRVGQGEVFAVFGKSGSGKTTLLKTICGLHRDFAGEVQVADSIAYFNLEELFGLELTLRELECAERLIASLQLEVLKDRPLGTYSGGQKQRALVALGLSNRAEIIVLDEPTSALDDEMAQLVLQEILNSGKTIIIATHDERVLEIANHTLELA